MKTNTPPRRAAAHIDTAGSESSEGRGAASASNGVPAARAPDEPTSEDIQIVAYLRWLDSGGQDGDDMRHWLEAEALLRERMQLPERF